MTTKYRFEIQFPFAPGCGWLQSPYPRANVEDAWREARQYVDNAYVSQRIILAVRVVPVEVM